MSLTTNRARVILGILLTIGAAALVAGLILPRYTDEEAARTPLSPEHHTLVLEGKGSVIDLRSLGADELSVDSGVPVRVQRNLRVVEPSDDATMTVQLATAVIREDGVGSDGDREDAGLLDANIATISVDRRTGRPVGEGVGTIAARKGEDPDRVAFRGQVFKWPYDTRRETYDVFDVQTRRAHPAEFAGEVERDGITLHRFRMRIAPTDLSEVRKDPRDIRRLTHRQLGREGTGSVAAHLFYTNDLEFLVEPRTGAVVDGGERPEMYLGTPTGERLLTVTSLDLRFSADTVAAMTEQARARADRRTFFDTTLPPALVTAGVLVVGLAAALLAVGAVHSRREKAGATGA